MSLILMRIYGKHFGNTLLLFFVLQNCGSVTFDRCFVLQECALSSNDFIFFCSQVLFLSLLLSIRVNTFSTRR